MQDLDIVEQMQVPQILCNQWIENLFFFSFNSQTF